MEYTLTGGESALAMEVVVAADQADFALKRAAILTGEAASAGSGMASRNAANLFEPLRNYAKPGSEPAALQERWIAVRTTDCAAYAVADCPARLDALMRDLVRTTQLTD